MLKQALRRPLTLAAAFLLALPQAAGFAESANPALWGTSGLLTVPSADTLETYSYAAQLRYFPLNSGLSGAAMLAPLKNLELGLVFGAPPAQGFSSLAASVKYRILNQAENQPLSLAVGASLIGLGDTPSYVPGSNAFLMLSRGFDWDKTRIVNLHGGFMGSLSGARLVAGLDVPILDFARIELEYLGNLNLLSQAFNLGVVVTPIPQLTIEAALMQRPTGNFWDRDFVLGLGWHGDWGTWFNLAQPSVNPSAAPSPVPSATALPQPTAAPTLMPPAAEKGSVRIRAIDKERITALETAHVTLKQPATGQYFEGNTDISGEIRFERIPIGTYEVQVEKTGWGAELRMLSVQSGLETFLEVPLTGQGGAIYGAIEAVDGQLSDLDLEIYDPTRLLVRRVNLTSSHYRIEKLPPGAYTLVVKQAGAERLRLNVLVKANAESQYDLTLPPSSQPSPRPTAQPSPQATALPTPVPTPLPTVQPTVQPTAQPSTQPSTQPTTTPSPLPTPEPTLTPPPLPSSSPRPSPVPSSLPSVTPTPAPTAPPGPVQAQIQGLLKSKAGAVLPGVRLELKNDDLLVITLSTAEGRYIFRDIPQGVYKLSVSKDGYKRRAFQITISKSETLNHDFVLEPN